MNEVTAAVGSSIGSTVSGMNGFDLFALVVLLICVLGSLWRGAIVELFSLAGWVLAFVVARLYGDTVGQQFFSSLEPQAARAAVAWVATFIVVMLLCNISGFFVKKLLHAGGLSVVDRLLGGVIGCFKAGLILLALVWVTGYTPLPSSAVWQQSLAVRASQQAIALIKQNNGWQVTAAQPK